jgi:60 kDa SS-A/Ro ribonucleoprotein
MNKKLIESAGGGPKIFVPQTTKISGREQEMKKNEAGGMGFKLDIWDKLDRFLMIGTVGGTYYTGEKKLTIEGIKAVRKCLKKDGQRVIFRAHQILKERRSAKPSFPIFALALAASDENVDIRRAALFRALEVIRTGTQFFLFLDCLKTQRGLGGRAVRRFITKWMTDKDADRLAYQMVKYRNREGWTWRDVLRLSRIPGVRYPKHDPLFCWATQNYKGNAWNIPDLPELVRVFEASKAPGAIFSWPKLIKEHRLTHEMVDNSVKKDPEVWGALLEDMPVWALMRNLGRMSSLDMFGGKSGGWSLSGGPYTDLAINGLSEEAIVKSKVHPLTVLIAMKQYSAGRGLRGSLEWYPNQNIIQALDWAFKHSFRNLMPTGKSTLIAIDYSGSMGAEVSGTPNLSVREAAVAMSMCIMSQESKIGMIGFDQSVYEADFHPQRTLDDNLKRVPSNGCGTDCSLPIQFAIKSEIELDVFILFTDNQSWAGTGHPSQWLDLYRKDMGRSPKFIVCAMTANGASICDPQDKDSLECVGFDAALPQVIHEFVIGDEGRDDLDRTTDRKTVVDGDGTSTNATVPGSSIIMP